MKGYTYEAAMGWALEVMKKHPEFILAGSLALITNKAMEERLVNDLDFATTKELFEASGVIVDEHYSQQIKNDKCICYKVDRTRDTPYYYNIFVFDNPSDLIVSHVKYDGKVIRVQDTEQILEYKKQWRREKDVRDLGACGVVEKETTFSVGDIPW